MPAPHRGDRATLAAVRWLRAPRLVVLLVALAGGGVQGGRVVQSARRGPARGGKVGRPVATSQSKNWRRWKRLPADMQGPNETQCRGEPPAYVHPDVGVVQGQDYLFVSTHLHTFSHTRAANATGHSPA